MRFGRAHDSCDVDIARLSRQTKPAPTPPNTLDQALLDRALDDFDQVALRDAVGAADLGQRDPAPAVCRQIEQNAQGVVGEASAA